MENTTQAEQSRLLPKAAFLPSLNGGRGVAAFLVFAGHFLALQFATPVGAALPYDAHAHGRGLTDAFLFKVFNGLIPVPVNFFFLLSGFVLAWIYKPGQSATGFWLKRIAKVYPAYIVSTAVAYVLWGTVGNQWPNWHIVLTHVFLLQAWTPDQRTALGLNVVMWTLSNEIFLYLVFPALMLIFLQMTKRALLTSAVVCIVVTYLVPWLATQMFTLREPAPPVTTPLQGFDNAFSFWFTGVFPPMRIFQFSIGIILALLLRKGIRWIPSVPWALAICVVGVIYTDQLPATMRDVAGMLIPIAFLIAALVRADLNGKWSPLRSRPLLFLGNISYSMYAVHILFVVFTIVHFKDPNGAWDFPRLWLFRAGVISDPKEALPGWANIGLFVLYFLVTVLAAWVLSKTVEQPISRMVRARVRRAQEKKESGAEEVPELATSAATS